LYTCVNMRIQHLHQAAVTSTEDKLKRNTTIGGSLFLLFVFRS
jgi:hypothetical protein